MPDAPNPTPDNTPSDPPEHTPPPSNDPPETPPAAPARNDDEPVSRSEFNGLSGAVTELTSTVGKLVEKLEQSIPSPDSKPIRGPWTHGFRSRAKDEI